METIQKNKTLSKRNYLDEKEFLKELINSDSFIQNHLGIHKTQKIVAKQLEKLGFKIEWIENLKENTPPLLFAKFNSNIHLPTITLIAHTDVVTQSSIHPFYEDSNFIYGAGVADDKGGIVVGVSAIQKYLEKNKFPLNIQFVISPNEESGSTGFHSLFKKIGQKSAFVFGLEPALQCGSIIQSRSGNRWYDIQAEGLAAHSGRLNIPQINAAHHISKIIYELIPINEIDPRMKLNIGSFETSSSSYNTICGSAQIKIDTRFKTIEQRNLIHKKIIHTLKNTLTDCKISKKKAKTSYRIVDDCPPMENKISSNEFIHFYSQSLKLIEGTLLSAKDSGGAADINHFSNKNNIALDGLGPIGLDIHTKKERIPIDSLKSRSIALTLLFEYISEKYQETKNAS
ncbi:MAG: hypothetical protein CL678_12500 [Bdellovibrionaceae bacterium]|nr:hypothetical protein [Pseudobdellovibrionaceae bacterium]